MAKVLNYLYNFLDSPSKVLSIPSMLMNRKEILDNEFSKKEVCKAL